MTKKPKKVKRRWHLFIALSDQRVSATNPWEWIATFRDRPDAMAFGRRYTTTSSLFGSPPQPNGWKFKVTSQVKP